jgi:RHS repeat-associated protein
VAGSQHWALNAIGNWNSFDTDLNNDGSYSSTNDKIHAGTFSDANELTQIQRTIQGGTPTTLAFTYDKAGNLREQGLSSSVKMRYTHDAWNRLVKVQQVNTSGGETVYNRGEYEYNGLFQRVVKRWDSNILDATNALDEQRLFFYSGGWQILEEQIDTSWSSGHTTDKVVQHVWGVRYIDDLVLNRLDADNDGDYTDAGSYTHYALTDHQFSVVALISSTGHLIERVSYDAYGTAQHHWMQDVDGDGDVDANDESLATNASGNAIYQSGYNVDADFNRDGVINSTDTAEVTSSSYAAAIRAGWLSASTVGNTIGYCGYVFNPEHGGTGAGIYTVRFRHFDPLWGRWLERDPAGYMDSMSLYGYGPGNPTAGSDPSGRVWWVPVLIGVAVGAAILEGWYHYQGIRFKGRAMTAQEKAAIIALLKFYARSSRLREMSARVIALIEEGEISVGQDMTVHGYTGQGPFTNNAHIWINVDDILLALDHASRRTELELLQTLIHEADHFDKYLGGTEYDAYTRQIEYLDMLIQAILDGAFGDLSDEERQHLLTTLHRARDNALKERNAHMPRDTRSPPRPIGGGHGSGCYHM